MTANTDPIQKALQALAELTPQQVAEMGRFGVTAPIYAQKELALDPQAVLRAAKFGYVCHYCYGLALVFPGTEWVETNGQPSRRVNLYRNPGEDEEQDMPPLTKKLGTIACLHPVGDPIVDRGNPQCPHCNNGVVLDHGKLDERYVVQIDRWLASKTDAYKRAAARANPNFNALNLTFQRVNEGGQVVTETIKDRPEPPKTMSKPEEIKQMKDTGLAAEMEASFFGDLAQVQPVARP